MEEEHALMGSEQSWFNTLRRWYDRTPVVLGRWARQTSDALRRWPHWKATGLAAVIAVVGGLGINSLFFAGGSGGAVQPPATAASAIVPTSAAAIPPPVVPAAPSSSAAPSPSTVPAPSARPRLQVPFERLGNPDCIVDLTMADELSLTLVHDYDTRSLAIGDKVHATRRTSGGWQLTTDRMSVVVSGSEMRGLLLQSCKPARWRLSASLAFYATPNEIPEVSRRLDRDQIVLVTGLDTGPDATGTERSWWRVRTEDGAELYIIARKLHNGPASRLPALDQWQDKPEWGYYELCRSLPTVDGHVPLGQRSRVYVHSLIENSNRVVGDDDDRVKVLDMGVTAPTYLPPSYVEAEVLRGELVSAATC